MKFNATCTKFILFLINRLPDKYVHALIGFAHIFFADCCLTMSFSLELHAFWQKDALKGLHQTLTEIKILLTGFIWKSIIFPLLSFAPRTEHILVGIYESIAYKHGRCFQKSLLLSSKDDNSQKKYPKVMKILTRFLLQAFWSFRSLDRFLCQRHYCKLSALSHLFEPLKLSQKNFQWIWIASFTYSAQELLISWVNRLQDCLLLWLCFKAHSPGYTMRSRNSA